MPEDADSTVATSQKYRCMCGGDVRLVGHVSSDAHATESYECVRCGDTGDVQHFPGPESPRIYGRVVLK